MVASLLRGTVLDALRSHFVIHGAYCYVFMLAGFSIICSPKDKLGKISQILA